MKGMYALLLALAALFTTSCRAVVRADGGEGPLPVGSVAPDISGNTSDGKRVDLATLRGKPAVVYFYPKDGTPGCTKEACAFRDAFKEYSARGVTIFGVSGDSEASHKEFSAEHELPFPLVSDGDGSVAQAYGVSTTLGMASRVTFLIGKDGRVARVWPDVDPGVHAAEVLAALDAKP